MMFSLLELSIPRFVPFFRLGLSNLPLILAPALGLDLRSYLLLMGIRLLAQAVVGGTLFSYVFVLSLSSALASGLAMYGLSSLKGLSFVGVSLGGAFCGNMAQCLAGTLFLGRNALCLFVPVAGLGLATSTALGLAANRFVRGSAFIKVFRSGGPVPFSEGISASAFAENAASGPSEPASQPDRQSGSQMRSRPGKRPASQPASQLRSQPDRQSGSQMRRRPASRAGGREGRRVEVLWQGAFVAAALLSVLFVDALWYRGLVLAAVWIAQKAAGGKPRVSRSVLAIAVVTALSLLSPFGEVLLKVGGFPVTSGALEAGLGRSLVLCSSIGLSSLMMRTADFGKGKVLGQVFAYVGVFAEKFPKNKELLPVFEAADKTLVDAYLGK